MVFWYNEDVINNKYMKYKQKLTICLWVSIVIAIYEAFWFFSGYGLGLIIGVQALISAFICYYLIKK